jgi:hypothetical protein
MRNKFNEHLGNVPRTTAHDSNVTLRSIVYSSAVRFFEG